MQKVGVAWEPREERIQGRKVIIWQRKLQFDKGKTERKISKKGTDTSFHRNDIYYIEGQFGSVNHLKNIQQIQSLIM